jgi:RimJ/RimL family protein N-acetyltransferase
MNWQPTTLTNELVKLVPLTTDHFEELYTAASDPKIWEQHPTKERYKREVFQKFFDGGMASKTAFVIYCQQSGKVIGATRFYDYNASNSTIAIGYTFLETAYWGGRYNPSVKKLLIDYAFQYVNTVLFHIGATNIRSQKAVGAIGAQKREGVEMDFNGTEPIHWEYELTKERWANQ